VEVKLASLIATGNGSSLPVAGTSFPSPHAVSDDKYRIKNTGESILNRWYIALFMPCTTLKYWKNIPPFSKKPPAHNRLFSPLTTTHCAIRRPCSEEPEKYQQWIHGVVLDWRLSERTQSQAVTVVRLDQLEFKRA